MRNPPLGMNRDPGFSPVDHIPGVAFRFAGLDGLRGLAALLVVVFHVTWPNHLSPTRVVHNGYLAVDLFFLLSGFVIAASYQSRLARAGQVRTFLTRRFFRVYPLHLFTLGLLVLMEVAKLAAGGRHGEAQGAFTGAASVPLLVLNLLFLQGTGLASMPSWNAPSWTVSAEFVAYLLFAGAGVAGLVRHRRWTAAAGVAGLAAYAALALRFDTLDLTTDFGLVRCLAGFSIGVMLFNHRHALDRLGARAAVALEVAVVVALGVVLSCAEGAAVVLVVPLFALLLLRVQREDSPLAAALTVRPVQFLGVISYSLYLVHGLVKFAVVSGAGRLGVPSVLLDVGRLQLQIGPWAGDALVALFVALSVGAACLTYRFVEEPGRQLGRAAAGAAPSAAASPRARRSA